MVRAEFERLGNLETIEDEAHIKEALASRLAQSPAAGTLALTTIIRDQDAPAWIRRDAVMFLSELNPFAFEAMYPELCAEGESPVPSQARMVMSEIVAYRSTSITAHTVTLGNRGRTPQQSGAERGCARDIITFS